MEENSKKFSAWTIFSIVVFTLGLGMVVFSMVFGHKVETKLETVVVLREIGKYTDLTNKDIGTVNIALKAIDSEINVGDTPPTKVQLFRSKLVDGLSIDYLYGSKTLVSGMPKISGPGENLFDGNLHYVAYSFRKGDKQALYIDGKKIAEGSYNPATQASIGGFLVSEPVDELENDKVAVSVSYYDKVLSAEELKALSK
jgi:hypothetical protein